MRTSSWFVALALAGGCSGSNETPASPEPGRSNGATTAPLGYRCAVAPRVPVAPRDTSAIVGDVAPWFVGGPSGVRAYAPFSNEAELRWSDGRRSVAVDPAMMLRQGHTVALLREGRFAWTGTRYLLIGSERVTTDGPDGFDFQPTPEWRNHRAYTSDANHGDLRPVRAPIPANACDVRVTETAAGALVTWIRRGRGTCAEGGDAWALAFDARGEVIGGPRALTFANAPVHVQTLSARWDFGRMVVSGQGDRAITWVLDIQGATVAVEDAGDVACPRAGCARVRVEAEQGNGEGLGGATALRFEPLGDGRLVAQRSFRVRLQRPTVRGLAVSGDLVLVLHSPQGGGCDLSIVDLEQLTVITEHHENSTRACDERHVRALPRGFALAGFELPTGAFSVTFDCARPPR